jgi:gluconokinase
MDRTGNVQFVVMGVCGTGKTTLASVLADRLGCARAEADAFHSPANIAKMSAGVPLEDSDRWPWLQQIASWIHERDLAGGQAVVTCSALKRAYRDVLRTGSPRIFFIHLVGSRELIIDRMQRRTEHFMPAGLVDSQFAILEPLGPDERGVVLDVAQPPDALASAALAAVPDLGKE